MALHTFSHASHPKDHMLWADWHAHGIKCTTRKWGSVISCDVLGKSETKKRVRYSAYRAEVRSAAYAEDRGYYFKIGLNSIFTWKPVVHKLILDSQGLHDPITTLHDGNEYLLRHTMQRLRNGFQSSELQRLRWVLGTENVAYVLAKQNKNSYQMRKIICSVGNPTLP